MFHHGSVSVKSFFFPFFFTTIAESEQLTDLIGAANSEGASTWSGVEMNVSIICASIVVMRPILARIFPERFGSSVRGSNLAGQSFSMTSSSRARRAGHAGRGHAATGDIKSMKPTPPPKDIERGVGDAEGIHVHRDIEMNYKPASSVGSENELMTDNSVWISSPKGQ